MAPTAEQGASSGLVWVPLRPVSLGPGSGAGGSEPIQVGLPAGLPVSLHHGLAGGAGAPEGREHGFAAFIREPQRQRGVRVAGMPVA